MTSTRRDYNDKKKGWMKKFRKLQRNQSKAKKELDRKALRAYKRRRHTQVIARQRQRSHGVGFGFFKENEAHNLLTPERYKRFRYLITQEPFYVDYRIKTLSPGSTAMFTDKELKQIIRQTTTAVEMNRHVVARDLRLGYNDVQYTARRAFVWQVASVGKPNFPSSRAFTYRTQRKSPRLWKKLQKAVRANTEEMRRLVS